MTTDSAAQALARFEAVRDNVLSVLEIIETNRVPLASDAECERVSEGPAAHAFQRWRRSMREHELVRFIALWDSGSRNAALPGLVRMVRNRKHFRALKEALSARLAPHVDGDVEGRDRLAAARFRKALAACNRAAEFKKSADMKALTRFRHKHVAHREARPGSSESTVDYFMRSAAQPSVDTDTLERAFEATLTIVADIELAFAPVSTRWEVFQQAFRRNGEALWRTCRFSALE